MWFLLRAAIGGIFIFSGLSKILSPYQNFLYVVQAYALLPAWAETLTAQFFPWLELITGVFVALGLWTGWSLRAASVLYGIFICVVGQALIRKLSLENCGCFGDFIHLKPQTVICLDTAGLLLTLALQRKLAYVKKFSLDSYLP